jgi:predicted CoA-binding protein
MEVGDMTSKAAVDAFLSHHAIAVVGVSRSGKKFGNYAFRVLRDKGYRVYPIHPTADLLEGMRCCRSFADLPEPVQAALISVPPPQAAAVVREAAAAGIRQVWLQQGSESPEVLAACTEAGIEAVAGECILMFASPTGFHKLHRSIWGWLGRLPASASAPP